MARGSGNLYGIGKEWARFVFLHASLVMLFSGGGGVYSMVRGGPLICW